MRILDADAVTRRLPYPALVAALRAGIDDALVVPERGAFELTGRGDSLLTMPAWRRDGLGGVKIATVHPGNPASGLPSVQAQFFAFDSATGTPLALLDGTTLTTRRTAAISALGCELLARSDARRLLIVGAGVLAKALAFAHTATHRYDEVVLYARDAVKATVLARALREEGVPIEVAPDLAAAAAAADVIAVATTAKEAFLRGAWVGPGTHVSLMGAFTKGMAEADESLLVKARVFADTRDGVLAKGGEVACAIASGALTEARIEDDLWGLVGRTSATRRAEDITVFKSVGSAAFDLVAAELILRSP